MMNAFYGSVESVNITGFGSGGGSTPAEPLKFDNPDMGSMKQSFPDLKVYGDESMIPKPLRRIVTEKGDWVELAEGIDTGNGVIYREFSIYGRHQESSVMFIPWVKLAEAGNGYWKIVRKGMCKGSPEPEDFV